MTNLLIVASVANCLVPVALIWINAVTGDLGEPWFAVGALHTVLGAAAGLTAGYRNSEGI